MPTTAPAEPAEPQAMPGAVSPEPTKAQQNFESESMAELDALASDTLPKPEPAPKQDTPKSKKDESDLDNLHDDKKEASKPEEPPKPVKAAELRQAYEKSKETLKAKDAELTTLRNELKAAKEAPKSDPEKPALLTKVQEGESRIKALEEKLRLVDFQQSDDFVAKYQKPWEDAWKKAANEIQELTVELEDGTTRPATIHDLTGLAAMPLPEARKVAKKVFGEDAEEVMANLRKLRDLSDAQKTALDEAKANSEAHFKRQSEESLQHRQKAATLWKDENESWRTKFPKFFAPIEGDEEGNALLTRGYEMVDRAFSSNGKATPEERVKLHAELRNKAAAFPRLALQLKRARTEIAELKKTVAQYEESEPPAGDGAKTRTAKKGDDLDDALAELDSIATK